MEDLATNNSNGRKSFPEGHAFTAIIAENSASSLDSVYETDQALHCSHF